MTTSSRVWMNDWLWNTSEDTTGTWLYVCKLCAFTVVLSSTRTNTPYVPGTVNRILVWNTCNLDWFQTMTLGVLTVQKKLRWKGESTCSIQSNLAHVSKTRPRLLIDYIYHSSTCAFQLISFSELSSIVVAIPLRWWRECNAVSILFMILLLSRPSRCLIVWLESDAHTEHRTLLGRIG